MDRNRSIYMNDNSDHELVELFISCRSLKNMDILSKSDPVVVLYLKNTKTNVFQEFGRTEIIQNNLNPNFVKTFQIKFIFEEHQYLRFDVLDIDSANSFDTIGSVETTLGRIMGSKSQLFVSDVLNHGKVNGKLIIRGEKVVSSSKVFNVILKCHNIPSQHWFHSTHPFLKILKIREDNMPILVYQTEDVKNMNPIFKKFSIPLGKLCNGDINLPVNVEVWDFSNSGTHHYIGTSTFSISQLETGTRMFNFVNRKSRKNTGSLIIDQYSIEDKPTFIDYIRGGIQLNLITAIDFTASNGFPSNPNSLHFWNPNVKNQYHIAIEEVASILLNYDYDQMVPLFGFGGRPAFPSFTSPNVLHCFPLTGYPQNAEVHGLEGIIGCYRQSLQFVELNGPTLFAPLIREAMRLANDIKTQGSQSYAILLILTDGEIHDMEPTKTAIVDSAFLPLSIIIVGIGNADFTNMETLDGDEGLVDSRGFKAQRDLVQFVPFNKYKGSGELLAKNVLAELPEQLVSYMKLINKMPNPAIIPDFNQISFPIEQSTTNIPKVNIENYDYPIEDKNVGFEKKNTLGLKSQGF